MAIIRDPLVPAQELRVDSNGGAKVNINDTAGNALTSTGNALDVNIKSGITISVGVDHATDSILMYGNDGTSDQKIKTNASGRLQIDTISSALPTGAATEVTLSALNAKFSALGQQTMAASTAVVLASNQSAIPVTQSGTWTVYLATESIEIGTVNQGTPATIGNAWPVKPTDGVNSQSYTGAGEAKVSVTQPLPAGTNSLGRIIADQGGTWNINNVSGTISLPTGAASESTLTAFSAKFGTLGQKAMSGSAPMVIASDQSPIPVTQSGTWNINDISGTISLPSGAATATKQDTGNSSLSSIDTKTPALGQALAAASTPVVLTAAQITTLTPLTAVTANAGTNLNTSALALETTQAETHGTAGSAIPAKMQIVGGKDASGNARAAKVDSLGNQYTVITSPGAAALGLVASPTAYGTLRVTGEGVGEFADTFPGAALDTTDKWNTPTTTGGASATVATGQLTLATGTTANASVFITTRPTFVFKGLSFEINAAVVKFEAAALANVRRVWGFGSLTGVAPNNLVGFEITTAGALQAVVYAGGTLIASQALTIPTDGGFHRYAVLFRPDLAVFYVDSLDAPVAILQFSTPQGEILPLVKLMVNGATPPVSAPTYIINAVSVTDSGSQSMAMCDGTNPWRKATVTPAGALVTVNTDGYKATYRASIIGLVVPAAATDIFTITGSASKTVRVLRIGITATQTTGGFEEIVVLKRSTANTGGTSSTPTVVPMDSADPAATAVVRAYTAVPTLGTLVGNIQATKQFIPTATGGASTTYTPPVVYDFGLLAGKAVVLRGTSQVLAVNLSGVTITGPSFDAWVEYTEE